MYRLLSESNQHYLKDSCRLTAKHLHETDALKNHETLPPLPHAWEDFRPYEAERNLVGTETWYWWFDAYQYLYGHMYTQPNYDQRHDNAVQLFMLGAELYEAEHDRCFECPPERVANAELPLPEVPGFDANAFLEQLRSGDTWHQRFRRLRWDEEPSEELIAEFERDTGVSGSPVAAPSE